MIYVVHIIPTYIHKHYYIWYTLYTLYTHIHKHPGLHTDILTLTGIIQFIYTQYTLHTHGQCNAISTCSPVYIHKHSGLHVLIALHWPVTTQIMNFTWMTIISTTKHPCKKLRYHDLVSVVLEIHSAMSVLSLSSNIRYCVISIAQLCQPAIVWVFLQTPWIPGLFGLWSGVQNSFRCLAAEDLCMAKNCVKIAKNA